MSIFSHCSENTLRISTAFLYGRSLPYYLYLLGYITENNYICYVILKILSSLSRQGPKKVNAKKHPTECI